jgi:mRNA interferase HigB
MRIVTFRTIKEFALKYPDSELLLRNWYHKTLNSQWKNIYEVRNVFNSVDYVGNDRYVFNIKRNNYCLIVIIIFLSKKIYIRFIGTHAEYDRIKDCSTV